MQNQSNFLSPGRHLLGNLRFGKKFVLVGIVFLIPIAFLLFAAYQQLESDIQFAEKERAGLQLVVPARNFEQAAQIHRGRSQMVIAGKKEAIPALAEAQKAADTAIEKWMAANVGEAAELHTAAAISDIKSKWESAKGKATSGTPEESLRLHTEAIEATLDYIGLVSDSSNLTLDPDLDSFYVMDAITARTPSIAETAGKLRAKSVAAASRGSLRVCSH